MGRGPPVLQEVQGHPSVEVGGKERDVGIPLHRRDFPIPGRYLTPLAPTGARRVCLQESARERTCHPGLD